MNLRRARGAEQEDPRSPGVALLQDHGPRNPPTLSRGRNLRFGVSSYEVIKPPPRFDGSSLRSAGSFFTHPVHSAKFESSNSSLLSPGDDTSNLVGKWWQIWENRDGSRSSYSRLAPLQNPPPIHPCFAAGFAISMSKGSPLPKVHSFLGLIQDSGRIKP